MMGAVVGLGFAIGLLLVLQGALERRPRSRRPARRSWGPMLLGGVRALGLAILAAGAVLVATGVPVVALLAGAAGAGLPMLRRQRRAQRQRREQRAAWPDAVDDLLTAVRAGMPLPDALCEAAIAGPEPLRPGYEAFAASWRRGSSFVEGLAAMQRAFGNADADRVVVSLALASESGGRNVGRVLATQSDFLREDLRMRGEIDARQSWTVNAARVAVAAPWLAVAALSVRGEAAAAYASAAGAAVLLVTAVVGVGAYWAMTRIAALPGPQRLPEVGA